VSDPSTPGPGADPHAKASVAAGEPDLGEMVETGKRVLRRLGPAGPLAVLAMTLPAIGGFLLLGLLNIVGPWLKSHETLGVVLYAGGFAVLAGLAVLPTYAQSVLGGWAFGFAVGYPASLCGVLGGAMLGYVIGRRATGPRAIQMIAEQPKWQAVYESLLGGGFWKSLLIVTLLRIPPSSPFAMTNLFLAAMRVHPVVYALGTVIGLAPRAGAVVFVAAGLHELTFANQQQKWMWIAGIVLTIAVVAILGYMANRAIARVTARQ
jgi:uncharacterized membrane protein YdjX (TVP38/TMEM64 family)